MLFSWEGGREYQRRGKEKESFEERVIECLKELGKQCTRRSQGPRREPYIDLIFFIDRLELDFVQIFPLFIFSFLDLSVREV